MEGNFSLGPVYYISFGIGLIVLIAAVYIIVKEAKREIDLILAKNE